MTGVTLVGPAFTDDLAPIADAYCALSPAAWGVTKPLRYRPGMGPARC